MSTPTDFADAFDDAPDDASCDARCGVASAFLEVDEVLGNEIDPRDVCDAHGIPVDEADRLDEAWLADIAASGVLHDHAVDEIEKVTARARVDTARQYALFAQVLSDAETDPAPWCGPDPTLDPDWVDSRGRTAAQVRAARREVAVRSAAVDIATRVHLSERVVRTRAYDALTLQQRCPLLWAAFAAGGVEERNAALAATFAQSLPDDDPDSWAAFDQGIADAARRLPPGTFRTYARAKRERAHPESVEVRHVRAREDRAVWTGPDLDGMATLSVFGPAARVHAAGDRVDQYARHLHAQPGESRTLAQLRADVALDLLTGAGQDAAEATATKPAVAITVPVLSLLGRSDEPATLDGYGPIDLETAKKLAGGATSWVRILTHPITGTVLDVDRKTYRIPKDLRRWLGVRDPVCTMPGCGRVARDCDIDHRIEWQHGGTTDAGNTGPLCEPHHVVKTESLWRVDTDPETGKAIWTSPTGNILEPDPPPW